METIARFTITLISSGGPLGIVVAMTIESACIPLPSEIIMPFSGFLVSQGRFALWQVGLAGAFGNLIGSVITYWIGALKGRSFIMNYGKYFLVSHHDIDLADRWFGRFGSSAIFFSRLMPVLRTFISLPAGISRMPFRRFCLYTFVGSYLWAWGLAWGGMKLGEHWNVVGRYLHKFDFVIAVAGAVGIILWVVRHRRRPLDK